MTRPLGKWLPGPPSAALRAEFHTTEGDVCKRDESCFFSRQTACLGCSDIWVHSHWQKTHSKPVLESPRLKKSQPHIPFVLPPHFSATLNSQTSVWLLFSPVSTISFPNHSSDYSIFHIEHYNSNFWGTHVSKTSNLSIQSIFFHSHLILHLETIWQLIIFSFLKHIALLPPQMTLTSGFSSYFFGSSYSVLDPLLILYIFPRWFHGFKISFTCWCVLNVYL